MVPRLLALRSLQGKVTVSAPVSIGSVVAPSHPFRYRYPIRSRRRSLPSVRTRRIDFCSSRLRLRRIARPAPMLSIYPERIGRIENWEVYRALRMASGVYFRDGLTILSSVISAGRLNGRYRKDRKYGQSYGYSHWAD